MARSIGARHASAVLGMRLALPALLGPLVLGGCAGALEDDGRADSDRADAAARTAGDFPGDDDMDSDGPAATDTDLNTPNGASMRDAGTDGADDPASTTDKADDNPDTANEDPGAASTAVSGFRPAVRLSQAELNNVLRDILGDTSQPASRFLAEDEFSPFDNSASRQTVSQALVDGMAALAEDVRARATESAALAAFMPCSPTSAGDVACFREATRKLTRLFFRRAPGDDELARYEPLLSYATEADDFYVAIGLLLESLLQDPEFLYRLERPPAEASEQRVALDDHEIATRLSFQLWGSGPDDALLTLAEGGALGDSGTRRSAAEALLADDRARSQLARFHAMWLGYRTLPHDATLNAAFQRETEQLIEYVVFDEPQRYVNLFNADSTFLTTALAEHYGFPAPESEGAWTAYPSDSGRSGILGHGSLLSAFSKFSDTSPTQRGIFIRTRLLCLDVPPPPPTVDVDQPPSPGEAECKLDRYALHRESSSCAACHALFDPIGIGLENFDMQGRYREHDDDNEACVIEGNGSVPGVGDFQGPAELARLLTESGALEPCLLDHYLRFATAQDKLDSAQQAQVAALAEELKSGRLDSVIVDYVASDAYAEGGTP